MLSKKKKKADSVVGLEIEGSGIAAVEVSVNGSARVERSGLIDLEPGIVAEGEVLAPEPLSEALRAVFSQNKLPKDVRLGIANQRVAVRTLRLPSIENPEEIDTAVRFQAQDEIPMPIEQAVLDHQVVGRGVADDGSRYMDVVVVAARRDMVDRFFDAVNGAGLTPVGFDLAAFGLIRALGDRNGAAAPAGPDDEQLHVPAALICHVGEVTNLVVARGSACLFTRVSPFGLDAIAADLGGDQMPLEHARQWVFHAGLERPVEEIEGDAEAVTAARAAVESGAGRLVDELRLSLEYYGAQVGSQPIEKIVLCGPGSTIAGLPNLVQDALGQPVEPGRPGALTHLDTHAAARLTLPFGLALEE